MTHLQKIRIAAILNRISFSFVRRDHISPICVAQAYYKFQNPRFFGSKKSNPSDKDSIFSKSNEICSQLSRADIEEARVTLTEYLHSTRSLPFIDAEFISNNSPNFLKKLLRTGRNEDELGWSMNRFLRYHPVNEFEPFFESIGLRHSEYSQFLPRNLIFLNDDVLLLENYHVLCNYGIVRGHIGKIYKEAKVIFKYEFGVLKSKFQAFEEMGLSQSSILKIVSSCPRLLIGDKNKQFCKLLEMFKTIGIEYDLIEENTVEGCSYNWSDMYEILSLLSNMGCNNEQLRKLISNRPLLLLEDSRATPYSLIGLLLKLGLKYSDIRSVFLEFPEISIGKFLLNLRKCYHFLVEIEIEAQDIGKIVRLYPLLLGSCYLKKLNTIITNLNVGKKRLHNLVNKNPEILKDWVLGSKIKKSPKSAEKIRSREMRIKFLSNLGFIEDSMEMKNALKVFRGKGEELQERFDYLVNIGLKKDDVLEMIKAAPQILNQKKDVIRTKINVLVKLGYPVSILVSFPSYVSYTTKRIMLRNSMYNWLKDRGQAEPCLSLSTIVACSEKLYMRRYVMKHPRGPGVFEEMKKEIYSDSKL